MTLRLIQRYCVKGTKDSWGRLTLAFADSATELEHAAQAKDKNKTKEALDGLGGSFGLPPRTPRHGARNGRPAGRSRNGTAPGRSSPGGSGGPPPGGPPPPPNVDNKCSVMRRRCAFAVRLFGLTDFDQHLPWAHGQFSHPAAWPKSQVGVRQQNLQRQQGPLQFTMYESHCAADKFAFLERPLVGSYGSPSTGNGSGMMVSFDEPNRNPR